MDSDIRVEGVAGLALADFWQTATPYVVLVGGNKILILRNKQEEYTKPQQKGTQ